MSAHFEEVAADALPRRRGPAAADRARGGGRRGRASRSSCARSGKRVTRLSLLSGGEKALGAISFLFALFLARPCPFYLLDEVEAALDDTNIGRFVELLRRYSESAQFIVVTHQKKTMEAADVLYGVTMAGDGVSQIVSRRLPRESTPRPSRSALSVRGRGFEPLTTSPGTRRACATAIRTIVADADAAFDPVGLWPANEWDAWELDRRR